MNIHRVYVAVSDASEGTLSRDHALDIAEWVVRERPTVRQRIQRLTLGRSHDESRALAMREEWRRNEEAARLCTCGLADQEFGGHYPEHQEWCDAWSDWDEQ